MAEEVFCKCGLEASHSRVKNGGVNDGKFFFACANWRDPSIKCDFFRWAVPMAAKKVKKEAVLPKPHIGKPPRSPSVSPPRQLTPIADVREVPDEVRRFVASSMRDYHRAMLQRSIDEAKERVKGLTEELREFEKKMNEQDTA